MRKFGKYLFSLALIAFPAQAQPLDADRTAAVIFAYHHIGEDENPSSSLRTDQFAAHIAELAAGGYTVKSLPDILTAFETNADLAPKTVALTFDGGDASVLKNAVPLLEQNKLPYTLFIVPGQTKPETDQTIGWNDLQTLKKSGLATIGIHPAAYIHLAGQDDAEIKRQVNSAIAIYREQMGEGPTLFAYPFGEYSAAARTVIESLGLRAAFGQHSGVAYAGADRFALPRFSMTEKFGDMERFEMTAGALPFPVTDIVPTDPYLQTAPATMGFTVPETLASSLGGLSCFVTGQETPAVQVINARVEMRLSAPVDDSRVRVNCTLPGPKDADPEAPARWRWMGMLLTMKGISAPDVQPASAEYTETPDP